MLITHVDLTKHVDYKNNLNTLEQLCLPNASPPEISIDPQTQNDNWQTPSSSWHSASVTDFSGSYKNVPENNQITKNLPKNIPQAIKNTREKTTSESYTTNSYRSAPEPKISGRRKFKTQHTREIEFQIPDDAIPIPDSNKYIDTVQDEDDFKAAENTNIDVNNDPEKSILSNFFHAANNIKSNTSKGQVFATEENLDKFKESAYFGQFNVPITTPTEQEDWTDPAPVTQTKSLYINVHEPFCIVTVGVQGSGKSHTMSVLLESCLLSTRKLPSKDDHKFINVVKPMCAMVLHYDQNSASVCEATGIISQNPCIRTPVPVHLAREKMVVLVSPTFYKNRKSFYGDYCIVKPLLFKWNTLTAGHIMTLMRVESDSNILYMAMFLDLLRTYQRQGVLPNFKTFVSQITEQADVRQRGPLNERLNLLESFIQESKKNSAFADEASDVASLMDKGMLIVVDLTDPLLNREEANSVFQLVTEQFRVTNINGCGKLLALDEAHKYMSGEKSDDDSVRLMRHDGMRVIISTQSPKSLRPELLELVSAAILHRFHSKEWFDYLQGKIKLDVDDFDRILELEQGGCRIFAGKHAVKEVQGTFGVLVRPKMTADRGSSRINRF